MQVLAISCHARERGVVVAEGQIGPKTEDVKRFGIVRRRRAVDWHALCKPNGSFSEWSGVRC